MKIIDLLHKIKPNVDIYVNCVRNSQYSLFDNSVQINL